MPTGRSTPSGDPPAGLDALLGGLNPEQLRAVTHGEGPLLVVAGAGTGKTQVITRRIAWLIATRRAKPSEILALTFTEKAAAEMQVRVDQLVPYGYTDTTIGTFHAFGDRLIREYALELGLPTDVRVLSRAGDRDLPARAPVRLRARRATGRSATRPGSSARSRRCSAAARTRTSRPRRTWSTSPPGWPPRRGEAPDDEALAEEARRQGELARAYARYQELLEANGCIDFGDQVALALRLVRTSAAARAEIQARFRYVLVDEFQDTNRAQSELVSIVADRTGTSPSSATTTSRSTGSGAPRSATSSASASGTGRPGPSSCGATTARAPAILEASHRLIRFNDPDRLEVQAGISKRLVAERGTDPARPDGPARDPSVRPRRGRPDRGRDRGPDRRGHGAARHRDPRPGERPRGPDPAQPRRRRRPVAVLGHVGAVRPAGGPPAAGVPARDRRPRLVGRRVRASRPASRITSAART